MQRRHALPLLLCLFFLQACGGLSAQPTNSNSTTKDTSGIEYQVKKTYEFPAEGVYASNELDGSRLNDITKVGENRYKAIISPASTPVNASAYFAFQMWSKQRKTITLSLKYTEHKHRYIPKISRDGKNWSNVLGVVLDEGDTLATFNVELNDQKVWIAAQEVIPSSDTYAWVDQLVASNDFLKKEVAGKTVLNNDLYVLSVEQNDIKPSAVFVARQHPPESPGGTFAFKGFLEEVLSSSALAKEFRSKFNLYVFPVMNPDGIDLGHWRHNANGADLNRDWADFKQPETQTVRDFVNKKIQAENKTVMFGIDFHTSYNGPYLLILNAENERNAKTRIIPEWIKKADGDDREITQYRRRDQALPYGNNWYFTAFGAEGVTYEDGDEVDRDLIVSRGAFYGRTWMEAMLEELERSK